VWTVGQQGPSLQTHTVSHRQTNKHKYRHTTPHDVTSIITSLQATEADLAHHVGREKPPIFRVRGCRKGQSPRPKGPSVGVGFLGTGREQLANPDQL